MRYILTVVIIAFLLLSAKGQPEKVKGKLSASDTIDLSVINIYPDSFPNVSVIFKAETKKGEPVWNLIKEKMTINENSQKCEIISLEQISKNKSINIGIVIDHSGSMIQDNSQLYDKNGNALYSFDSDLQPVFPEGYISPLENAKIAVKAFVSTFNNQKDFISVTGFSSSVSETLPLTQNIFQINSLIDSMKADSSTALYDAMISSVDRIKESNGVKVLVVLTDGQDNSSISKWNDVVDKANLENIPIYIIGLGDVNIDTCTLIAKSTKGNFYFAKSSNSLKIVYAEISNRVQAYYNLIYRSINFSSVDSSRQIELSFDNGSNYTISDTANSIFPAEIVEFIAKKEHEKQYVIYGGIAFAILVSTATLLFYFQRRKRNESQPNIKNIFPNPSDGNVNFEYESSVGQLHIMNFNGEIVKTIVINGLETEFDLTDLKNGNYFAIIKSQRQQSNAMKFIIQR
jgi:Ca-activated chloride channel family protein